ncbi:MAG: tetratricopeptide repeat protein [Myxococcota bacterium]
MPDRERYWDCLDHALQASSEGHGDEALTWFDEALKVNPNGGEAHSGRGEILWDEGRHEDALREFRRALELDPDLYSAHLNCAELLIEEFGEHEEAISACDELLMRRLEPSIEAEVYYLKAKALFYLDDMDGALFLLRRAIKVEGEVAVYRAFEGQILFELGRYEDARQSLERSLALDPENSHALYYEGLVLEHLGEDEASESLLRRAARLAPDQYPLPVHMDPEDFEAVAVAALEELPAKVRAYVARCPLRIEDLPSRELVQSENVSPQIPGLFSGAPRTDLELGSEGGPPRSLPTDRILLFKRNLEKFAHTRKELIEEIHRTVKHEIGHFLGLAEQELERLGLG